RRSAKPLDHVACSSGPVLVGKFLHINGRVAFRPLIAISQVGTFHSFLTGEIVMKIASSSARLAVFMLGAAALVTLRPSGLLAQAAHTHAGASAVADATPRQEGKGGALVRTV